MLLDGICKGSKKYTKASLPNYLNASGNSGNLLGDIGAVEDVVNEELFVVHLFLLFVDDDHVAVDEMKHIRNVSFLSVEGGCSLLLQGLERLVLEADEASEELVCVDVVEGSEFVDSNAAVELQVGSHLGELDLLLDVVDESGYQVAVGILAEV